MTYSSVTGVPIGGGTVLQGSAVAGQVLNMMDDPRHTRIRRLVSSGLDHHRSGGSKTICAAGRVRTTRGVEPGAPFDFGRDRCRIAHANLHSAGLPETDRHWLFEAVEPGFISAAPAKSDVPRLNVEGSGSRLLPTHWS